jgi:hypothetical protein
LSATAREHFRQTLNEDSLSSSCGTSQDRHGPVLERHVEIRDTNPVNPDPGSRDCGCEVINQLNLEVLIDDTACFQRCIDT